MDTFSLAPARWRTVRALGRNPVVRFSDRVEAIATAMAIAVALIAAPVVGAVGTAVHDARSQVYAEAAQTRHPVTAVVTSADQTAPAARYAVVTTVHAHWRAEGVEHAEAFSWDRPVAAGNAIEIWVDSHGRRVSPPPSHSQAAFDAVLTAVMVWLGVVTAAAALAALVRLRLDRFRDAAWERSIRSLADNQAGGSALNGEDPAGR
jgi:hypothetical protein